MLSDVKNLANSIEETAQRIARENRTSVPGKIVKYSAADQEADVMVLIKEKFVSNREIVEHEIIIPNVPVIFPAAADDVYITLPVDVGTLGELSFSDRSLENWMDADCSTSYSVGTDYRHHNLSFAYFTPGLRPLARALESISSSDIVIKNEDAKISLKSNGKFKIENSSDELFQVLCDLTDNLLTIILNMSTAKTPTMMGAQLSDYVATNYTTDFNNLTTIKNKLTGMKG